MNVKESKVCSLHFTPCLRHLHFTLSLNFNPISQSAVRSPQFTVTVFSYTDRFVYTSKEGGLGCREASSVRDGSYPGLSDFRFEKSLQVALKVESFEVCNASYS